MQNEGRALPAPELILNFAFNNKTMEHICKRCFLLESGREDIHKNIKEHIDRLSENEKSSDEDYRRRLGVCAECEFLSGGVCLKCGCYPEFRAAFKKQKCPYKKW